MALHVPHKTFINTGVPGYFFFFQSAGERVGGLAGGGVIKFITQSVKQWGDKHLPQKSPDDVAPAAEL